MDLSNNLISQFAKITKDQNGSSNETIVYGTAVSYGDKLYVNIDGSDSITPVVTTSEVKAGERVTILLKDHSATILGNVSNPAASTETVGKVLDEYDTIVAKIGNFELVIADKVTTEQLQAEVAIINEALIGKATIEQLTAVNAKIEKLDVTKLEADIASINQAIITKAEIADLEAVRASVNILETDVGNIETLIGGNLTMDNIQSLVLTTSKVTVDNAFIKDAMIDRVSASKLTAGTINTSLINIGSEDGAMSITGSLQQFKDADGNVRIQIGKDTTGDFTFVLYGADGQGQLINQNGITASAISDGLIINNMVADNAAIAGSKLDIESVITEINGSTETIKSSKIYLDDKNQTLEVAFNQLSTKVDLIEGVDGDLGTALDQIATNTTAIGVMQGEINTLISNTTITKSDGTVVQLKDAYTTTEQTVSGINGKVSSLETNYNTLNGEIDNVTSQIAEFDVTLYGFETRVSNAEVKMDNMTGDMVDVTSQIAEFNTTLAKIDSRVSSTETKIDNIGDVGAQNIANGTTDKIQTEEWSTTYGTAVTDEILLSDHDITVGEKITLSIFIKSSTTKVAASFGFFDSTGIKSGKYVEGEFVDSGTSVITTAIPEGYDKVKCYIRKKDNETAATVEYSKVKIEKGTTPTDWCPSIADMKNMIDDASKMELPDGTRISIKEKVAETSVTVDGISSSVSSLETHFDENGTVTNLTQQVSVLEQFASQFTMEFFQKVENADQGVTELLSYIHFDADGISIGQETYPIRLQLTKDRIKFLDSNDQQVAYFSEGKLYVNNAEILGTFKIGNYGFMSTANGGLTIGALS
jgi:hypothetical protein